MKTRLQVRDFDPFYAGAPEPVGLDKSTPTAMGHVAGCCSGLNLTKDAGGPVVLDWSAADLAGSALKPTGCPLS